MHLSISQAHLNKLNITMEVSIRHSISKIILVAWNGARHTLAITRENCTVPTCLILSKRQLNRNLNRFRQFLLGTLNLFILYLSFDYIYFTNTFTASDVSLCFEQVSKTQKVFLNKIMRPQ